MKRKLVLIVEFEQQEAMRLAAFLERGGYEVVVANTGARGLDIFFSRLPDLIFVNLLMPDLQGVDLIRRVRSREEGAKLPVVAISQIAGGSLSARQFGANELITKPINPGEGLELVQRILGVASHTESPTEMRERRAKSQIRYDKDAKGIPERGLFKRLPFHQLLARIFRRRSTGELLVEDELGTIRLGFQDGLPVMVEAEGFSRRLARDGLISSREAQIIRRRATAEGISTQAAARQLQLIETDVLEDAIRGFGYRVMRDLARPNGGRFQWTEKNVIADAPLDPSVVISLAVKRHFPLEKINEALSDKGRMNKPMYLADDPSRLPDLNKRAAISEVVESTKRGMTLRALVNSSSTPNVELLRAAYALGLLHIVTFDPAEAWMPPKDGLSAPPPIDLGEVLDSFEDDEPAVEPEPEESIEPAVEEPTLAMEPITAILQRPEGLDDVEDDNGIESVPEDAELTDDQLLRLGKKLLSDKHYSKAQRCFDELLARRGDEARLLRFFAGAVARNRFLDPYDRLLTSVDAIRRGLTIEPRSAELRLELSRILHSAGHVDLAKDELRRQLQLTPDDDKIQAALRSLERRERRAG
ncbi:MAG TPA: response regulator [bacterium]|nr:response regulator [bacterium]